MSDKPVLIQNAAGIYYGTLERLDTREGTALLSDGYMISPRRHITFAQLLGMVSNSANGTMKPMVRNSLLASADEQNFMSSIAKKALDDESADIGFRLVEEVRHSDLLYLAESNTITDYAIGGIAEYRTVYTSGSMLDISPDITLSSRLAPTISITGVIAVIPIDEEQIVTRYDESDEGEGPFEEEIPVAETFRSIGKNIFSYKVPGTLSRVTFNEDGTKTSTPIDGHMSTVIAVPTLLAVMNNTEPEKAKKSE